MKPVLKKSGLFILIILGGLVLFPEANYAPHTPDESYLADSANYVVPSMPDDWTWNSHLAKDGTKIRWGETSRSPDKPTVIFLPGYTSSLDIYGEHMAMLAARGYNAVGLDLRGQGGSGRHRSEQPEKLFAENFGVYSDDVVDFIKAQNFAPNHPVIILGSSFGGHVALRMAGDHDAPLSGLVLLAPAYVPNTAPFSIGAAKSLTAFAKLIGKDMRYAPGQTDWKPFGTDLTAPNDCASNIKRLYMRDTLFVRRPEQRVGGVTNNYLRGLITSGEMMLSPEYAAKIELPVTMVLAQEDVVIDGETSKSACTDLLPNCKAVVLPQTGHCLMFESDTVINAIFDEIDTLAAQLP